MSDLVPEGYYRAVAIRVEGDDGDPVVRWALTGKEGGQNRRKQVVVYFQLLEGAYTGERLPWWGVITENTWERVMDSLRYMGLKGDDLERINDQDLDQIVSVKVEHNDWEGKVTARVGFVNKLANGAAIIKTPLAPDEVRMFAAQMRSKLATRKEVDAPRVTADELSKRAAPREANESTGDPSWMSDDSPPPPTDDDIPF